MGKHRRQILRAVWSNDAYSNSHSQPDTHPNRNAYGYCHGDRNAYTDFNANSDRNIEPDANTISNSDCGTWRN